MKIADPLIFMVYPWVNFKSSDNGQGIEYLLKKYLLRSVVNSMSPSRRVLCLGLDTAVYVRIGLRVRQSHTLEL